MPVPQPRVSTSPEYEAELRSPLRDYFDTDQSQAKVAATAHISRDSVTACAPSSTFQPTATDDTSDTATATGYGESGSADPTARHDDPWDQLLAATVIARIRHCRSSSSTNSVSY